MNNETRKTDSTTAAASPLTVKEAPQPVMIKKIGKTTYRVKIHFSETSKETMSDKIKRLILNDSEKIS
ncbi:transposon-encoded TnpW family protein [Qiania dongpingensis]|uniref:Transposon-encoded TnpW family protein n=1 Tax=Qiania dongpingensis TaxID=2763669 RepID=A0A7G9G2D5_9FIRM|nr:transposon-encoded TnpW family protein [Qiania dongpingensis]QNM04967.1 transposon-encoded TnpW family protein [Qiania dongpingensis]